MVFLLHLRKRLSLLYFNLEREFVNAMTEKDKLESEEQLKGNQEKSAHTPEEPENGGYSAEPQRDAERDEAERDEAEEQENDQPSLAADPAVAPNKGGKRYGVVWPFISAALAAALVIVLINPPLQGRSEAVATVNGEQIEKDKLYDALVEAGGQQTLDTLIVDTLINQELKKAGIEITDADSNQELELIKKNFPSEEEFNAALQQSGMSLEEVKEQLKQQVKIRKLLEPKVTVTDEEVKNFFDENKASFDSPEQVRASQILVGTKEEAETVRKQLNEGADFAQLAQEKSLDPQSKDSGGDLNFFAKGQMEKPLEDAAFSQKKDELGIVQTSQGFHVLKVTDRKDAVIAKFEDKKADIRQQLVMQKVSEMSSSWIADLKANAKIENSLQQEPADAAAPATTADGATE